MEASAPKQAVEESVAVPAQAGEEEPASLLQLEAGEAWQ